MFSNHYQNHLKSIQKPTTSPFDLQKREIPWEKVPYVPRPSLIADPITAFGKRRPKNEERISILEKINREGIQPSAEVLARPIQPYISARDETRQKVFSMVRRHSERVEAGGSLAASTARDSMDYVLPRLHNTTADKRPHRRVFYVEPAKYQKS